MQDNLVGKAIGEIKLDMGEGVGGRIASQSGIAANKATANSARILNEEVLGKSAAGKNEVKLIERIREEIFDLQDKIRVSKCRMERKGELLALLEKNEDVARILELMGQEI